MKIRSVDFKTMIPLFEKAAKDNHRNAENYSPKRMRKRWEHYAEFNLVEEDGVPIAFGGVYEYSGYLVRVVDRFYLFPEYRVRYLATKGKKFGNKPGVDLMIPYQTQKYCEDYECFFSIEQRRRAGSIQGFVDQLRGYTLLEGTYYTSSSKTQNSIQHVAATNGGHVTKRFLKTPS